MKVIAIVALALVNATGPTQEDVVSSRVEPVDWPADFDGAAGPLPEGPLQSANQTLLPVLIPSSFLNYQSLQYVGEELAYTASVAARDATMTITGTRVSFGSPKDTASTAAGIEVQFGEQTIFASFGRYGVAYLVTIECASPSDRRCTEEGDVLRLANTVELVGGRKGDPSEPLESGAGAPLPAGEPADPLFTYEPPGELVKGSGTGVRSSTVYAPGIRFPLKDPKAYLNSQVWGYGGYRGPGGGWRDQRNYTYPWRDTFCEIRSRTTPACPGGTGHQGVDIRPNGPEDKTYWAVATEGGRISSIGSYSVTLLGDSTIQYRYLHLEMAALEVKKGQRVARGQKIGLVSNDFGGTATTVHLHFEILQNVQGRGWRHVPPYSSLVEAYRSFN